MKKISLKPSELPKSNINVKTKTIGVLVKTKVKGKLETYNIELNNGHCNLLATRNLTYISTISGNSLKNEDLEQGTKQEKIDITKIV